VIAVTTIFGRERDEEESPDEPEHKADSHQENGLTHAEESPQAEKAEPVHTVPNWQRRDSVIREDAAPVQDNPTDSLSTPT